MGIFSLEMYWKMFPTYSLAVNYLIRFPFDCRCYTSKEKKRILRPLFRIQSEYLRSTACTVFCSLFEFDIYNSNTHLLFDYIGWWPRGVNVVCQENAISCSGCLFFQVSTVTLVAQDIIIYDDWGIHAKWQFELWEEVLSLLESWWSLCVRA